MSVLVLIGPMGAGKTSIGRRVAKALGVPFFDTDIAVTRAHGPIEQIFAEHGEEHFRALERAAVIEALATDGVVSLGGGAVLHPETQADLRRARVAQLHVEPRVVAGRLRDTTRPLLQTGDPAARWTEIMQARRPIYDELADRTFDTSHGPLQQVVDDIVAWVRATQEDPA